MAPASTVVGSEGPFTPLESPQLIGTVSVMLDGEASLDDLIIAVKDNSCRSPLSGPRRLVGALTVSAPLWHLAPPGRCCHPYPI